MRTETIIKEIFTFDELSDSAKKNALEKQAEFEGEDFHTDFVYDDANAIANILGIELDSKNIRTISGQLYYDPAIYFTGFWSQGDGACFEGTYRYAKDSRKQIREYAPQDTVLHSIADRLYDLQKPFFFGLIAKMTHTDRYCHSGCMTVDVEHALDDSYNYRTWQDRELPCDELKELMREFADWIYKQLEAEYDYRTSEEACRESIDANDYEFDENGDMI